MSATEIITLYTDAITQAVPFAIMWFFCDLITTTILRSAFGGKLTFRGSV